MGEKGHVKVFGMWASPIAIRVEWALKLKGVEYEYVDEDLGNKSEDLLRHNPVTKKVPVLVHDGKPLAESLVILEYIDEVWKEGYYPIMPTIPTRGRGRGSGPNMQTISARLQYFRELEDSRAGARGKKFFGGATIGYLDIVVGWFAYWFPIIGEVAGVDIVNARNLPLLNAWFQRFLDNDVVKKTLPPRDKVYELNRARREMLLSAQSS
uniref:Glutathione S-transferase n=1 Tax=Ananas comosus var. bracteatus TaxID=296719 RepID=A0A6V7P6K4_ANACO|nr:unnamed protein product [Ananas comosus var. bracteatus]